MNACAGAAGSISPNSSTKPAPLGHRTEDQNDDQRAREVRDTYQFSPGIEQHGEGRAAPPYIAHARMAGPHLSR